ncbi:MAG: SusF/SusE family outer membrane protein [Flavobacterium sp.]
MKKSIKILVAFIGLISLSCTNDVQDTGAVPVDSSFKLLAPTSGFNLILDGAKLNQLATTFVWSDPANPTGTTVTYTVEAALKGTNFAAPITLGTTTDHFLDITVGNIDTTAKALGLAPLVEGQMDVHVKTSTGTTNFYTINVTPYQPKWSIIGDATAGGWSADTNLVFNPSTSIYSITVPLSVGSFKFRLDGSWTTNYGDDGNNLSLDAGGANIPITTSGTYTIVANFATHTYTITPVTNVWCIIGDATAGAWSSDTLMDYNSLTNKYSIVAKLTSGAFKFRIHNDWSNNFGDDGNNLSLDAGGANIPIATAGTYYIVADFNGHTYTITQL